MTHFEGNAQAIEDLFASEARVDVVELLRTPDRFVDLSTISQDLSPGTVLIDCRQSVRGPWAGALALLEALLPDIEREAPELLDRFSQCLAGISPQMRRRFPGRKLPLTESGPVKERVRSYPVDRAFRLAHGFVDLVLHWQSRPQAKPLQLLCWGFEDSGAMTLRFLRELIRRSESAKGATELRFVLWVAPGQGSVSASSIPGAVFHAEALHVPGIDAAPDRARLRAEAEGLEDLLDADIGKVESEAARLISLWEYLQEPQRVDRWRVLFLAVLNHLGWYEDALHFAQPLIGRLDEIERTETRFTRWHVVSGLFNSLAALGRSEEAHRLVRDEAMAKVNDPTDLVSIYYTMAMLHVRFLPEKDLELGEHYLNRSMEMVEVADLGAAEKHYLKVFNLNGIAFIRHLQGEPLAAIELCQDGYDFLEEHLAASEYRLHRSVLLYNLAQVYASTGALDTAYEHYTAAISIDPNYSEYYNERAGVLLRMERPEEALVDLEKAIDLSPPYPEVKINLGQVLNILGRYEEAKAAYDHAIELDPERVLPWLGRAQALEALGQTDAASIDYRRSLDLDPEQHLVWANVAALDYEQGKLQSALEAIDEAVRLRPDFGDLYQSRAVVLSDLGRPSAAAADLHYYLELYPNADDASTVRSNLQQLQATAAC